MPDGLILLTYYYWPVNILALVTNDRLKKRNVKLNGLFHSEKRKDNSGADIACIQLENIL
jgi:hypothetical protein